MLLCLFCIVQVSCKKEDQPAVDNTPALLQNKNWKLIALSESSVMGVFDIYNNFLEDCNRDDLFRFNPANIFVHDEGPSKCNPADQQMIQGTWTYTESSKTLHFTFDMPSDVYDITITSINENSFSGKSVEVDAGVTYTTTWSFSKQ